MPEYFLRFRDDRLGRRRFVALGVFVHGVVAMSFEHAEKFTSADAARTFAQERRLTEVELVTLSSEAIENG